MKRRTFVKTVLGALAAVGLGKKMIEQKRLGTDYYWGFDPAAPSSDISTMKRFEFNPVTRQYEPVGEPIPINKAYTFKPHEVPKWHNWTKL